MVAEWYCQVMGSEVGPLSQRQLVDMVRQHQVNPEDLVRRNASSWVPAFQVKGLFEAAAKPPKPEPQNTDPDAASNQRSQDVADATQVIEKQGFPAQSKEDSTQAETIRRIDDGEDANTNEDWFCIASGEKKGPLGFGELRALAKQGTLRGCDRVWRASWPKFQIASDVDGLPLAEQ